MTLAGVCAVYHPKFDGFRGVCGGVGARVWKDWVSVSLWESTQLVPGGGLPKFRPEGLGSGSAAS